MRKMDNNEKMNVIASFIMGLPEAQDLFSEVGELSVIESSMGLVLQLKDNAHGWHTYFWKGGIVTFADKVTANHVVEELGFKPDSNEVAAWLIGKESVMVQVIDTNTRPDSFMEEVSMIDALELGFSIGIEDNELYIFAKEDPSFILQKGDEVNGDFKREFLNGYNPYHWVVTIEKIELDKVVCRCSHVADYRVVK